VREEKPDISFRSLFPSRAPVQRRAAVAELLTRLNYGLIHGSFQMDMEDGEIRTAGRIAKLLSSRRLIGLPAAITFRFVACSKSGPFASTTLRPLPSVHFTATIPTDIPCPLLIPAPENVSLQWTPAPAPVAISSG
jgi:hypothetical protein